MKTLKTTILALATVLSLGTMVAQEESESSFSAGVDLVSSYVWRGAQFGSGPALQPCISYSTGGLEIGAWGSNCFSTNEGFEADLYAGYSFDFGLSIGFCDYYFGTTIINELTGESIGWLDGDSHFFEPSLTYEIGSFSIMGAYMFGEDTEDLYLEAGYAFGDVSVFLGAGNGQYTDDGDFMLANAGVTYSTDVSLGSANLPIFGSVILNPSTGGFYTVVGLSF